MEEIKKYYIAGQKEQGGGKNRPMRLFPPSAWMLYYPGRWRARQRKSVLLKPTWIASVGALHFSEAKIYYYSDLDAFNILKVDPVFTVILFLETAYRK